MRFKRPKARLEGLAMEQEFWAHLAWELKESVRGSKEPGDFVSRFYSPVEEVLLTSSAALREAFESSTTTLRTMNRVPRCAVRNPASSILLSLSVERGSS